MKVDSRVAKTDNEWTKHLVENQILRLEKKGSSYKVYGKGEHGEISLVGSVPVSELYEIENPEVAIPFNIQKTYPANQTSPINPENARIFHPAGRSSFKSLIITAL